MNETVTHSGLGASDRPNVARRSLDYQAATLGHGLNGVENEVSKGLTEKISNCQTKKGPYTLVSLIPRMSLNQCHMASLTGLGMFQLALLSGEEP